jgi:hypothetical protein
VRVAVIRGLHIGGALFRGLNAYIHCSGHGKVAVFDEHGYESCGCRKCGGILGQLKMSASRGLCHGYM